jgi:hypothetical protein
MRGRDHQPVDHARLDSMRVGDGRGFVVECRHSTLLVSSFPTDLRTAPLDLVMISPRRPYRPRPWDAGFPSRWPWLCWPHQEILVKGTLTEL